MKRYEVVAILKPDLPEEDITAIIERSSNIITERKGVIAKIDKWGKRRLSYEIKKSKDGFYFLIDFAGDGPIIAEMERNFKIDDRVLKFLTVKKGGAVTREGMDAEIAAAEAKRTQIRIETETSSAAEEKTMPQGDKVSGEARPRRPYIRKPYSKEEQPKGGE